MHRRRNLCRRISFLALALTQLSTSSTGAELVYDPLNHKQNLLSALRTLQSVNNQIQQLQNETQMLLRMDQNLTPIGQTVAPQLRTNLNQLSAVLGRGDAIALSVAETQSALARLYPTDPKALSGDAAVTAARQRWAEALAAFKRSALAQAQIAESIVSDGRLLEQLLTQSKSADGGLKAAQTGNELAGLSVKQSLQTQALLAANARAQSTARARDLADQEEARQRFQTFMGTASAYSGGR